MQERTRNGKNPRMVFGVPWTAAHLKAFRSIAERIPTDKTQGNPSALARAVLEQFMFAFLDYEECVKLGLLNPWDVEDGNIPRPSILRFALKRYDAREEADKEPATERKRSNGHATLPS